ncbi:MAG TPA: aminotransferase class V-fold PLP-dependent enzyme [Sphingomonas sp.]|uniref:pyridoxal phosphate-dependent decarboxylase family protein n=1 Tax=Sphingomonas sp. TaxID=28214 RepID=UPI002B91F8CB|nr:aminotransferase class V-fold PLP-dependent enzyme [Sphingomonas sp.]HMI20499.1 aminotransferase class V-fold PLP-dependent enzyme [Sphingomonas sp.]
MTDNESLNHLSQAHAFAKEYLSIADEAQPFPSPAAVAALAGFDEPWAQSGAAAADVLTQLHQLGSPATVRNTGGRYYGLVMGGCLPVALAANWLAGAWDQCVAGWAMSPAGTFIEEVAARWLLEALDLPRESAVGFVTGSTMASFSAIATARSALLARAGWNLHSQGTRNAPEIKIVASDQEHPAVRKSLTMLGIGQSEVRWIETDDQGSIIPEAVPHLDDKTILLLQAGNVNGGSLDPFHSVCHKAREAGAWVHVDGAFGLWARASKARRHLARGVELADSWAVDMHKWLNVPYDSAVYICRHTSAPLGVFNTDTTYLVRERVREPNNLTPELSRRARGVEIWAALKFLGQSGLEDLIERCCRHAKRFAEGLAAAGYEILNDVVLNQVVAAYGDDEQMARIISSIQGSGTCWLGPTHWKGRFAMRISVSSWATTDRDVEQSLRAMVDATIQSEEVAFVLSA